MAPAILALVLAVILLLFGNVWIWAALAVGTILIVFTAYVLLWPAATPVDTKKGPRFRRKAYTPLRKVKMRSCDVCGGAGALRLTQVDGKAKLVPIPRSEWLAATWRYANLQDCLACQGSGNVPQRSGRPPVQ